MVKESVKETGFGRKRRRKVEEKEKGRGKVEGKDKGRRNGRKMERGWGWRSPLKTLLWKVRGCKQREP